MTNTPETMSSATTYDVETLVKMAWQGRIRVPHFQRDFRWRWEDVRRLFDSIVRGYPVGSLLLWSRRAPAETLELGALHIEAPALDPALWVVDGQQRVTSLANALSPEGHAHGRFSLAYDLNEQRFVRPSSDPDPLVIPLPTLFDLQGILKWFSSHPQIADYLDAATNITKRIRQYPVPAYRVEQDDQRVLQDIFDRMNNYGKRLSRAEVFSALNAGDETNSAEQLNFDLIADHIDSEYGFGTIDNDTVLQAMLARRSPDVQRDIRSEFAEDVHESRDAAFGATEAAIGRAVSFLQEHAGVPHVSMLAYRHLLVVLARLFAHHPTPDARNLRLLRRWYWRAALIGPESFKGSTTGAIRILCNRVDPDDLSKSVQDLLGEVERTAASLPNLRRFRTNEGSTKIVLCAWWNSKPRSLETGKRFEMAELSDCLKDQNTPAEAVRYVVARQSVPENSRTWAANRVLMPMLAEDTKYVSGLVTWHPDGVDADDWRDALRTHGISTEAEKLLYEDRIAEFIEERQKTIRDDLEEFIRRMCESDFEDTPPLADLVLGDDGVSDGDGSD